MVLPDFASFRLFVGLLADEQAQHEIDVYRQCWDWPVAARKCHLTQLTRLHMTIHLPEQVPHGRVLAMQSALRSVRMDPLEIVLNSPIVWNKSTAVLRAQEHAELNALHARIEHVLRLAGFRSHRSWTPHVTLARGAAGAQPPTAPANIRWPVREFVLIWSQLGTEGFPKAHYEVLEHYGINPGRPRMLEPGDQLPMFPEIG